MLLYWILKPKNWLLLLSNRQPSGVTIHKRGTVALTMTEPPNFQGCKAKGKNMWTVSADDESMKKEQANNVYGLPSVKQSVQYLHAAAGFPVEESWIKAIKAGNYNTWPNLTPSIVRRHFPESDETQQGHMK